MSQHPLPTVNKSDQTGDWFRSLIRCLNWNERLDQKALWWSHTKLLPCRLHLCTVLYFKYQVEWATQQPQLHPNKVDEVCPLIYRQEMSKMVVVVITMNHHHLNRFPWTWCCLKSRAQCWWPHGDFTEFYIRLWTKLKSSKIDISYLAKISFDEAGSPC